MAKCNHVTLLPSKGLTLQCVVCACSRANLRQCLERLKDAMPASATGKATTLQLLKRAKLHITVSIASSPFGHHHPHHHSVTVYSISARCVR